MDHLNSQQSNDLHALLLRRRDFLRSSLERGLHADNEESVRGTDPSDADESIADIDAEMALTRLARDQNELNDVERALERFDSGDYAQCNACGSPIGYPRLLAHPSAILCLACQEKRETAERH